MPESPRVETFIIHLERATERIKLVEMLHEQSPFPSQVIEAVDGRCLTVEQRARYRRNLHRPHYPFRLYDGEIACFLSHRLAWSAISASESSFALVLEDDARPVDSGFWQAVEWAARATPTDCLVRIQDGQHTLDVEGEAVAQEGRLRLHKPSVVGLRATALLVGKTAAKRLVEFTSAFDRPIDTTLQLTWLHRVRILTIAPALIEIGSTSSTIQPRRNWHENLHRGLARPFYRRSIHALSQAKD